MGIRIVGVRTSSVYTAFPEVDNASSEMDPKQKHLLLTVILGAPCIVAILSLYRSPIGVVYSVVAAVAVAAAVDNLFLKRDTIQDHYTLGGIVFGVVASALVPSLQGQETWWLASLQSAGCAVGAFVVMMGLGLLRNRVWGRRHLRFDIPTPFMWTRSGDVAALELGADIFEWSDLFTNEREELRMVSEDTEIDSKSIGNVELVFCYESLATQGQHYSLMAVQQIQGLVTHLDMPRPFLGFGIVKAMAALSAIFGWMGAGFVFLTAFFLVLVVGMLVSRERKFAFMPFLSLGALLWILFGRELRAMLPGF